MSIMLKKTLRTVVPLACLVSLASAGPVAASRSGPLRTQVEAERHALRLIERPDSRRHQNSLNTRQAVRNPDGTITVVLSGWDPGVANWIDPVGAATRTLEPASRGWRDDRSRTNHRRIEEHG